MAIAISFNMMMSKEIVFSIFWCWCCISFESIEAKVDGKKHLIRNYGKQNPVVSDVFIEKINSHAKNWRAGRNFHPQISWRYLKSLMGVEPDFKTVNTSLMPLSYQSYEEELPEDFDSREKWSNCPTIKSIADQGGCGSCWAVSSATAMSDRVCIHSNGTFKPRVSAQNLLSCCDTCGHGCNGGRPIEAWQHWIEEGIVTGGEYNSLDGCQPYEIEPCEHHVNGTRGACVHHPTPICHQHCTNPENTITFKKRHTYGLKAYTLEADEKQIMIELITSGPAVASFPVYADFVNYKSGVYSYVQGGLLGHHAVRILGWGVENEIAYWLFANSWNNDWGDKGTFKFPRGKNYLGIEEKVTAGIPKV